MPGLRYCFKGMSWRIQKDLHKKLRAIKVGKTSVKTESNWVKVEILTFLGWRKCRLSVLVVSKSNGWTFVTNCLKWTWKFFWQERLIKFDLIWKVLIEGKRQKCFYSVITEVFSYVCFMNILKEDNVYWTISLI